MMGVVRSGKTGKTNILSSWVEWTCERKEKRETFSRLRVTKFPWDLFASIISLLVQGITKNYEKLGIFIIYLSHCGSYELTNLEKHERVCVHFVAMWLGLTSATFLKFFRFHGARSSACDLCSYPDSLVQFRERNCIWHIDFCRVFCFKRSSLGNRISEMKNIKEVKVEWLLDPFRRDLKLKGVKFYRNKFRGTTACLEKSTSILSVSSHANEET